MITDLIVKALGAFAAFIVGLFPDGAAPGWLTVTIPQLATEVGTYIVGVNSWVPLDHVGVVLAFVALVLAAAVGVKLVRIVASFLTLGGGSAA